MNSSDERKKDSAESWPPLWSIGLAAMIMLIVPFILYTIAPEGPLREGDTVFSTGRHRVPFVSALPYQGAGYERTCVIELRDPLVVVQRPSDLREGALRVRIQGRTKLEFPFCPPDTHVIVKPQQIFQKPNLLSDLKDSLADLFTR